MRFKPERALYFSGEINAQTSMDFIVSITKLYNADPVSPITLFIVSTGGNVSEAFAIYDYVMKVLKPKLQTVALGEVNSMAIILFMMGDKRYIGKLAAMRFHKLSRGFRQDAYLTEKMAENTSRELSLSNEEYLNLIVKRLARPIAKSVVREIMETEMIVRPSQAVKLGLAHKIL